MFLQYKNKIVNFNDVVSFVKSGCEFTSECYIHIEFKEHTDTITFDYKEDRDKDFDFISNCIMAGRDLCKLSNKGK